MEPLKGIIPPLITPLTKDRELDVKGLENLIEHEIQGGVHGLFILGTTGEGTSLSYKLRDEAIRITCEKTAGRVPVLVGITDPSVKGAIELTRDSERFGAAAVVLAPPFYYDVSQDELSRYLEVILKELSLPVVLYNIPSATKVGYSIELLKDLLPRKEIIAVKDSSGDFNYFQQLRLLTKPMNLPVFMGPEELLFNALMIGADGGVAGGANVLPARFVRLYEAVKSGRIEEALRIYQKVMEFSEEVFGNGAYGGSRVINGIKSGLAALGICEGFMAPPLVDAGAGRAKRIKDFILRQAE